MARFRILTVGGALATSLCLGACSSSSGGSGTVAPPPDSTGSGVSTASSASAAGPAPGGSTPVALPGSGSGGDFCNRLTAAAAGIEELGDATVRDLKPYIGELRSLVAAAPAAIKSDVMVLEQVDEQVVSGNSQARSRLNTPATAAHLQHFLAWMSTNCPGALQSLPTS